MGYSRLMNAETPKSITREALNDLPVQRYEGPIHFVDTPALLHAARLDILGERALGFDTETRPAFSKGESYLPSIVQVATANGVHIFPLRYTSATSSTWASSPNVIATNKRACAISPAC